MCSHIPSSLRTGNVVLQQARQLESKNLKSRYSNATSGRSGSSSGVFEYEGVGSVSSE